MMKLVECVPNFSEGRDHAIITAIADSVRSVQNVRLLSVEPDKDYNRVVVTFVGEPAGVVDAAFSAMSVASKLIDMRAHKGEHPRLGATDVVPFIPVNNVTMDECVLLAQQLGKRVGHELQIPVYLYEAAASIPGRRNLSTIRKGEYEGLAEKLKDPAWLPDYGLAQFNPQSGATVIGAREFLIAYNVNLTTNNRDLAHAIALKIRESGRTIKDASGNAVKIPGSLKSVKAMGVVLDRLNIAQVSMNLTNYHETPPHTAFEEVRREAEKLGINVTGSEIVGLIPKEAMILAGKFYQPQNAGPQTEEGLIGRAIASLGLSQIEPFDPHKKIIEYMIS
jgi:glutamate formiminotransferase/formiminotetrahydrofolate cyclodeaminase